MSEFKDRFLSREFKKMAKAFKEQASPDEIEFIETIPTEDLQDYFCGTMALARVAVADFRGREEARDGLTNARLTLEMVFSESEKLNPDFVRPDIGNLDALINKMAH